MTTRPSTKRQIAEFTAEQTGDVTLLRPAGRFPAADLGDVASCLRSKLKPKTAAQMRTASEREVIRRHGLGRY